jgi:type II secretion system protein N
MALKMSKVAVSHRKTPLLDAEVFNLKPTLGALFSGTKSYNFAGRLHRGTLEGAIHVQDNSQPPAFSLKSDLEGIDLTTVPALEPWREQLTSGSLGGRIQYDQRSAQPILGAQLTLRDVALKLDIPLEKLDHLRFANITADLKANGSQLEVRQCRFSGPQGEGQITGTIQLRNPASDSSLNLSGHFKPNPELIMQLQGTLWGQMLTARKAQAQGGYPFRIQGRFSAPQWQLH